MQSMIDQVKTRIAEIEAQADKDEKGGHGENDQECGERQDRWERDVEVRPVVESSTRLRKTHTPNTQK